jgi:hypothetical protein
MNLLRDKPAGAGPDASGGEGFLWLDRLRHRCASRECPERGRVWPRWRTGGEAIAFAGRRYCGPSCAEAAFAREIEGHLLRARQEEARPHRVPLGLLLVSRGLISSAQLQEALRRQRERPGARLGSVLLETQALDETSLTAALGIQWGCPVFPLANSRAYRECAGLVPLALLQWRGILPAHHAPATGVLHVAFTRRIDYTLLYAIEQMCGVRAVPCVAPDRLVAEALQQLQVPPSEESVFDSVRGPHDMAHLAAGYAGKLGAARVQMAGAADHVWLRFENARGSHHLLFHSPPPKPPATALPR